MEQTLFFMSVPGISTHGLTIFQKRNTRGRRILTASIELLDASTKAKQEDQRIQVHADHITD